MKYNSLIIIPTYNEAENIEAVIKKVIDLEDKNDILVIDDNSPDGTAKIVKDLKLIANDLNRNKKILLSDNKKLKNYLKILNLKKVFVKLQMIMLKVKLY